MHRSCYSQAPGAERGAVLMSAMMFLLIITLMILAIVNATNSEEKMARNFRDYDIALAAAEAALRDAELHVSGAYHWPYTPVQAASFDASCSNGLCDATTVVPSPTIDKLDFYSGTAPGSNSVVIGSVTASPTIAGVPSGNQPRYMIEMTCSGSGSLTGPTCNHLFRITAQGRGRLPETRVVLQEMYASPSLTN